MVVLALVGLGSGSFVAFDGDFLAVDDLFVVGSVLGGCLV